MLSNTEVRVFAYAGPCDMRKQIDGLSAMVRKHLGRDPEGGDVYLFRNRRGDMVKILFFDHGGHCLLCKRLAKGTFRVRFAIADDAVAAEITQAELGQLLTKSELLQADAQNT